MNNFNFVASFYDLTALAFFGESIRMATAFHLKEIDEKHRVLIIGGGTGVVLKSLPPGGNVMYVEKSSKMLAKARSRERHLKVDFVLHDFFEKEFSSKFDFVICPFFLDCFGKDNLKRAILKIQSLLNDKGRLIVTDFQSKGSIWLIRLMHLFFRMFANLESKKLKNIHSFILESGLRVEKEQFFFKNMIFSRVYGNL